MASHSPRRRQILEMLGLKPLVIPSSIEEPDTGEKPYTQVMRHARNKANAVSASLSSDTLIIGADTSVVMDGLILGKPKDTRQAAEYLRSLSGRSHAVYSGVCLILGYESICRYERSIVQFKPLSDEEIKHYIDTREPMDKAGAYGIQGYGSQFVNYIRGCYFNVMGFPVNLFYNMLEELLSNDRS